MGKRNVSEVEEKYFEKFRKPISELTCRGLFWGKDSALALEKKIINVLMGYDLESFIKIKENYEKRDFLLSTTSAASSTYYAASGNAGSRAKASNLFSKIFWYWRAWRCLREAEKLSDKFAKMKPIEEMSLGELDTRACILNKAGRREEALALISHGIAKISAGQTGTKHDLCLFLIHEAEVISSMRKYDKENKAEKNYQQAMKLSEDEVVPILTKVRVMKSYGKFLIDANRTFEAKHLLNRAYWLAEENGLSDQVVKIKALLACIK